jgi:hypothetical protein
MSDWRQHSNPWAEKLSRVSLPDGGESWKAMEALLDREMPTGRRGDWRRWVLLILLVLLLIGVCNCPGRKWFLSGKREVEKTEVSKTETVKTEGSKAKTDMAGKGSFGEVPAGGKVQGGPSAGAAVPGSVTVDSAGVPEREVRTLGAEPVPGPTVRRLKPSGGAVVPVVAAKTPARKELKPNSGTKVKRGKRDSLTSGGQRENDSLTVNSATTATKQKNAPKNAAKTQPAPSKDDEKKEKQGGWMVGIGLNQFFTVGGQQASSFNSGGITGTLGDYIPVPMVRYYFNPKLYVQLEAQINTPQYTKKNLVAVSTPVDSIGTTTSGATVTLQQSVAINKLFYFNLPLSVHYTVFDRLDLGAGLQYSRLTNGIGVFDSNYAQNGVDTLETSETKSFKGDSVFSEIKTHEFRFLLDANYTWRHFIFGLRYNQALSKFIHVEISPGQITQARNSSLQLYLRYIFWDGRKRKPLLPAK